MATASRLAGYTMHFDFRQKQSIIIQFYRQTNRQIRAQTTSSGQTVIKIIDKPDEKCLKFKLTTQVHLFLVLTVSLKDDCFPGYEQERRRFCHPFHRKHCFLHLLAKLKNVSRSLLFCKNVLVLTHVQH